MIVTYRPFGRLGNRLFLFAHLVAFSDYYSVAIENYAFSEYRKHFPYWEKRRHCSYGVSSSNPARSLLPLLKLGGMVGAIPRVRFWGSRDVIFDGEDSQDPRVRQLVESPIAIFEGWKLRSHDQIRKSHSRIHALFQPLPQKLERAAARINEARQFGDKVLGVHIRWEDYRGTDFFFSLREYADCIGSVRNSNKGQRISCVVSCPEGISRADLPPGCLVLEGNDPVADMYTLSACDYILAPPSTFSAWASFYGKKPLIEMRHHERYPSIEDGKVVPW